MIPSVSLSNVQAQLQAFLTAVLPTTGPDGLPLQIILAQQNRIPAPLGTSYVIMTPIRQERIETNVDTVTDAVFTGSIAGALLTITAVDPRFNLPLAKGSLLLGRGILAGTQITDFGSGMGGVGTYAVNNAQTISSQTIAAGTQQIQQATKFTIQLDFHAADSSSGDNAQVVTTLMRDGYAFEQFEGQSPDYGVRPLLADDARQIPFLNDAQAIEWRWVVECLLQANTIVVVPQTFADAAVVNLIDVDVVYPPTEEELTTDLRIAGNEVLVPTILTGVGA